MERTANTLGSSPLAVLLQPTHPPEERAGLEGREEEGLVEHNQGGGPPRDEGAEGQRGEARLEEGLEPRLQEEPHLPWGGVWRARAG